MVFHILPHQFSQQGIINQYFASVAASLAFTIVGSSVAWPSPTLIKMKKGETPITLDITEISWMVSLMFLGHMISPIPTSRLMDKIGKKHTCLLLSIFPIASWILIYYGESPAYLYVARFFAGMWSGIISTIVPLYIGEIAEPNIRGSLTSLNNVLINLGLLFTFVVGPYVTYHMIAIICGINVVLYVFIFIWVPESPYFYILTGKRQEALQSLQWLRMGNENIEDELLTIENSLKSQTVEKGSIKEIFMHTGNRKAFTIAAGYSVLKKLAGARILHAYASTTLPGQTFGLTPDECLIILGILNFVFSLSAVYFTAKFNRRTLLNISCFGCGTVLYTVSIWFYISSHFQTYDERYNFIVFVSFAIFSIIFSIGIGPVGTSIKGEMFSANVKALSSSLTTVLVAIATFLINKFYLIIANSIGMYLNYFIYGSCCFFSIWFTLFYVPDLQGKTLQEIQDILNKNPLHKNSYNI